MLNTIIKKSTNALVVVLGVSIVVFFLLHLTGDPVALLLPMDASTEEINALRDQLGLNDPLWKQYLSFLSDAVHGDFGDSLRHRQPALDLVLEKLPATMELTVAAMAIAILIAIPLGVITAVKQYTIFDYIGSIIALLGQSMPVFWLGLMLLYLFGVKWHVLPVSGRVGWKSIILPAFTLGCYSAATIVRLLRSGMVEVLKQDYIKTAQAKGLRQKVVVLKHALRNALLPVVTIVGLQLGVLLGGAVITETIFSWPGVGRLMVQAINNRDIPLVQAGVFILAVTIVVINLVTDLAYSYLDPRIRYE